jgi:quinol monooxygenase YgiN
MPVFITVKVKGDHARLFAAYDRIADYEEANVPELGCHVCAKTEDGMLVSGTWKSREAFEQLMASPRFRDILAEANLPNAPQIEIHEIYRSRH